MIDPASMILGLAVLYFSLRGVLWICDLAIESQREKGNRNCESCEYGCTWMGMCSCECHQEAKK